MGNDFRVYKKIAGEKRFYAINSNLDQVVNLIYAIMFNRGSIEGVLKHCRKLEPKNTFEKRRI